MVTAFLIVIGLIVFLLVFPIVVRFVAVIIPRTIVKFAQKTNMPFYLDFMSTILRRRAWQRGTGRGPFIRKASRQARRKIARQIAYASV